MKRILFIILVFILAALSCRKTKWKCDEEVSYQNDIQPLFDAHCNKCHSYNSYAEASSMAGSGVLYNSTIKERRMPPEGEEKLSLKQRKKIYCWIEAGAPDN